MGSARHYVNMKVPRSMAYLATGHEVRALLGSVMGSEAEVIADPFFNSTGSSPYGPWREGDIGFSMGGERGTLSYDFIDLDDKVSRIFRMWVSWDEEE